MQNKILMGHLFALVTILLWGTTFISTKVLLRMLLIPLYSDRDFVFPLYYGADSFVSDLSVSVEGD